MNNHSPASPEVPDPLDALLREAEPYIPDNGFTTRVMISLTPRRRFGRLRVACFGVAWLVGAVILFLHAPGLAGIATGFLQHARHGELSAVLALAPVILALGSLVWAVASWGLEEWG